MSKIDLNKLLLEGKTFMEGAGTNTQKDEVFDRCQRVLALRRDEALTLSQVVAEGIAAVMHFLRYEDELDAEDRGELFGCVNAAIQETSA